MSNHHTTTSDVLRSTVLACVLVALSPALASGDATVGDICARATPIDLDAGLRADGVVAGEPFLVRLEVPSAGLLLLDVAAPGGAEVAPTLGFAPGCGAPRLGAEPALVDRSATHLLLAAAPGTHVFRVASSDPRQPLGGFRLRTAFSPDGPRRSFAKQEPEGEDEEEIEVEPNPLVAGGLGDSRPLAERLAELCRSGEVDDHGDSFPCATFLRPGRTVMGEIGNGWGDDQDVFVVVLGGAPGTELRSLEIEAAGDVDLGLYDRAGHRLAAAVDGGDGWRIVRTVRPGTYFVRVGGRDGAEGFYSLRVEASAW